MLKDISRFFLVLGAIVTSIWLVAHFSPKVIRITPEQQRVAAVHEAAHVVAHFAFDAEFELDRVWVATITEPKQPRGDTAYTYYEDDPPSDEDLRLRTVTSFAGCAAEKVLLGLKPTGCQADLTLALEACRPLCQGDAYGACSSDFIPPGETIKSLTEKCLAEGQGRAEALVQANADVINRLADLIMSQPPRFNKRTLEAKVVEKFIGHEKLQAPPTD